MNPRYFIGITLPPSLSRQLYEIQRELIIPRKTMEPLVPHITLLDPNTLLDLSPIYFLPKVKEVAANSLPIDVSLHGLDAFGQRALYISINSSGIIELHKKLVDILPSHIRAKTVSREFIPHLTLAQAKPNQKLTDSIIHKYHTKVNPLLPQKFTVKNLDNFQWIRPRAYEVKEI